MEKGYYEFTKLITDFKTAVAIHNKNGKGLLLINEIFRVKF